MDGRERLHRQFVAEEVASSLRHGLVNKVSAIGALTYHLRRQLPAAQTPESALAVLPMIDAELAQASQLLDLRFVKVAAAAAPLSLGAVVEGVLSGLPRPPGVKVVGPGGAAPAVAIDPGEADLALHCLVENAVEAVGERGTVTIQFAAAEARASGPMCAIEVLDDGPGLDEAGRRHAQQPFFTTRPGRLGVGLGIALRIAQRWRGTIELAEARPTGLTARLLLPESPP